MSIPVPPPRDFLVEPAAAPPLAGDGCWRHLWNALPDCLRGGCPAVAGLALVAGVAFVDFATGPELALTIFYLAPVALAAWTGGLTHGLLLAVCAAVACRTIDALERPEVHPGIGLWNGIALFATLVLTAGLVARVRAGMRRERRLARTDPLTGAANGRTFYEAAATEAQRAQRMGRPLTLAYLDLDNFKQLNDRLGHAAGDEALVEVVNAIQPSLRVSDLLARLGGDEFALLLPETGAEGALALLARVQELVTYEMASRCLPISLSIGVVTFVRPPGDVDLMVREVDLLMYGAKRKGKGRIEHALIDMIVDNRALPHGSTERRATARRLSNNGARVREQGRPEPEEFAVVRDVSAEGIGLSLDRRFPTETLLVVEPLNPGARTLLVRVVTVAQRDGGWLHGCELTTRLGVDELACWLGLQLEAADWPAG